MLKAGRIVLVAVLGVLLLASSAGGRGGGQSQGLVDPYWLGSSYAGGELNDPHGPRRQAFSYGDCELPEGEGGCSVPVQVQNWTGCERNPIGLDRIPYKVFLLRGGGLAAVYEATGVDIGTGRQTVTVFTNEYELMGAALRDVHRRSQAGPQPLAAPVYPLPVLRELKRVTAVAGRLDGIGAIAREVGLAPAEVELRLRIAELLGPDALAGVPVPTMSTKTVERLRQLAFRAQYNPAETAREAGISRAELRKKVRLVRGLAGGC